MLLLWLVGTTVSQQPEEQEPGLSRIVGTMIGEKTVFSIFPITILVLMKKSSLGFQNLATMKPRQFICTMRWE